jgi:formyltetrahydrofolate deformylase
MSPRPSKNTEFPPTRRSSGVLRIDPAAVTPHRDNADEGFQPLSAPLPRSAAGGSRVRLILAASSATLLIVSPASQNHGLIFASLLSRSGARVVESETCSSGDGEHLFQRIHVDSSRVLRGASGVEQRVLDAARFGQLTVEVERVERRRRMALFVSKVDHCLYDLLLRHRAGELDCDIPLVISNHSELGPVAQQFGVEYAVVPKSGSSKAHAERAELELLAARGIDLVVLARYMQVLSPEFIARWQGRVINIHHSFLPAFAGAKAYHQARERGVKLIGATAHYATTALDDGPIIEQDVVRSSHRDGVDDLKRKGRDLERQVLARAVRWHLQDRVLVHGQSTVIFG